MKIIVHVLEKYLLRHAKSKIYNNVNFCRFATYKSNNELFKDENHWKLIKNELSQAMGYNQDQWENFSQQLIDRTFIVPNTYINSKNLESVILRICCDLKLFEVGRYYYHTVLSKSETLSDGILARYLSLCVQDQKYATENQKEILTIYQQLTKSALIEPTIAERCIEAICLIEKHWEDAFRLLNEIKCISNPTATSYCYIIEACFKFGKLSKGWELMRLVVEVCGQKPLPPCYLAFLKHCQQTVDNGKFDQTMLNDLFIFLEEYHLKLPNIECVEELEKVVYSLSNDSFRWSLKETFVSRNALCISCKRILEPVSISNEEFQALRRSFVKKAMIGSNVFLNSSPQEVSSFQSFITQAQPYDIVIDGLNVAYTPGKKDAFTQSNFLKEVVNHFVKKNMKVVVLGRKHMLKWPYQQLKIINSTAKMFLATNVSQDDPFLLYAALKGGEKTYFLSRDFMRSHLFLLEDPHMKLLFKKWLVSHQYILGPYKTIHQPVIFPPLPYRPTAQKLSLKDPELCWHLPYEEVNQPTALKKKAPWICVRREPLPQ